MEIQTEALNIESLYREAKHYGSLEPETDYYYKISARLLAQIIEKTIKGELT